MNNQTKLEFRLVPTKGVVSGKGFLAEWTRKNEVIDMDAVIAEAPILEKSDSEIRCAWPEDYGSEVLRHTLWASVTKVTNIEADPPDVDRMTHAGILPPTAD